MINWANLQNRVNTATIQVFGGAVTVDGQAVTADFLEPSSEAHLDGVQAMTTNPQLLIVSADVPQAPVGKIVGAGGRQWRVAEAHPDGHGLTKLMLEAVL
jgi:hypothetical protein